jgi:tyrosine-protein phosphatase YwqE
VGTLLESEQLIQQFIKLGYSKLITTPHVMSDFYRNEPQQIQEKLDSLNQHLAHQKIDITIEAAAEYYLDEVLIGKVNNNEQLLTFGTRYLLFETNFLTEPFQLNEFIFSATTQGYKPVLAHPERYQYLVNNFEKVEDLRNRGVLFQINIPSILGAYSKPIQKLAVQLINKGYVDFLGSDCHNQLQMEVLKTASKNKNFKKALNLPLLNRLL